MTQFKENMIFQMFKDKALGGAQKFKQEICEKFSGLDITTLYRKIINYQIETYGNVLNGGVGTTYVSGFTDKSNIRRKNRNHRDKINYTTNKIIERNEV